MNKLRGDLDERIEHEPAIPDRRVRDHEPRRIDDFRTVEQEVKVERSRPPTRLADPPEVVLDRLEQLEQFERRKLRIQPGGRVEELGPRLAPYGRRSMKSARGEERTAR